MLFTKCYSCDELAVPVVLYIREPSSMAEFVEPACDCSVRHDEVVTAHASPVLAIPCQWPQACSGAGEWRAALSLLDDVQAEGLRPGGAAYVAAMAACARGGVVERALELLDRVLVEHPGDETARRRGYL